MAQAATSPDPKKKFEKEDTVYGERKLNHRRLALLGLLLMLLSTTAVVAIRYLITRQPIQTSLPPVTAFTNNTPPRYQYSIYGVNGPLGVAVSPDGNRIYVTEGAANREIVIFDRQGKLLSRVSPPNSNSRERYPVYVATYKDNVYVTDRLRHTVDIFDLDGKHLGIVPPPEGAQGWSPMGVGFDQAGNMLITDSTRGEHRLLVLDPDGALKYSIGTEGTGDSQFSFPNGVAADHKGRTFVADGNNARIQVFDAAGNLETMIISNFGLPRGLAIDSEKRLYLADATDHSISVWGVDSAPRRLFSIGSQGFGDGQFNYPNSIATDITGRVYITDRENHRVQVWIY